MTNSILPSARVQAALNVLGVHNDPAVICKLLRALADGKDAKRGRYDTILIGAAEMIAAFERITREAAQELERVS